MKRSQILQWKQLVLVELVANRIACGFVRAERQQDHFGSPMAAGARGVAKEERERERESKRKTVSAAKLVQCHAYTPCILVMMRPSGFKLTDVCSRGRHFTALRQF